MLLGGIFLKYMTMAHSYLPIEYSIHMLFATTKNWWWWTNVTQSIFKSDLHMNCLRYHFRGFPLGFSQNHMMDSSKNVSHTRLHPHDYWAINFMKVVFISWWLNNWSGHTNTTPPRATLKTCKIIKLWSHYLKTYERTSSHCPPSATPR